MDQQTLQRILDLIGRTGDRVVVTDPAGENPYVLMGLSQYESLVDGGASAAVSKPAATPAPKPQKPSIQVAEDVDPPVDLKGMTSFNGKKKDIPLWKKEDKPAPEVKKTAPEAEGAGEEQFYLEPLE